MNVNGSNKVPKLLRGNRVRLDGSSLPSVNYFALIYNILLVITHKHILY